MEFSAETGSEFEGEPCDSLFTGYYSACTIRDIRSSCRSSYCDSVGSQHIFGLQGVNTAIAED
jgi:hypothetical protein